MTETPRRTRSGNETRQRTHLVQVRCTDGEHARIVVAAEQAGISVAAFVRHQCLGTKPPRAARRPTVEAALLAQTLAHLGKVGSNVNQIARQLNSGGDVPPDIAAAVADVRAAAQAIMRALGKRDV